MLPDLLHPLPTARVEIGRVRETLRFSFAGGGSDVISHALFEPGRSHSHFSPDNFADDLFVKSFVEAHTAIDVAGHNYTVSSSQLEQLLLFPPADVEVTRYRQHILYELVSVPDHRQALEQAYVQARQLISLLGESGLGHRLDINRRRIDILIAWQTLLQHLAGHFAETGSGLTRLPAFAQACLAEPGHQRLLHLLSMEDARGTLDVKLRVGYEGDLRHFEIVRMSEQTENSFYAGRWGRFWRKLTMLARGYRFHDSEVLSRFVDEVFLGVESALARVFQLVGDLEFYLAALGFRDRAQRAGLSVCLPTFTDGSHALEGLFNPLLLGNGVRPLPCTLAPAAARRTVVLTGPNSGGKTRLLQALGLSQLFGQCGFFVPAARAELSFAHALFVSIGEGAHAGQSEGRLGMELMRIRRVFEHARCGAMVIVDELCSGTNPGEGEQIFELVLSLLRELDVQAYVSTHFLEFARRLAASPDRARSYGLGFLQVELDARQAPTYRFVEGVASSSLALLTAARLGVTREELAALVARHRRVAPPSHSVAPSATLARPRRMPSERANPT